MNRTDVLSNVKRGGTALAFILYPLLAGFAFAAAFLSFFCKGMKV